MAIAREVAAVTRLGIEVAQPLYAYKILFYMIPCLILIEFRCCNSNYLFIVWRDTNPLMDHDQLSFLTLKRTE